MDHEQHSSEQRTSSQRRQRIADLMEAMAQDRRSALWAFIEEFGPAVAAGLRSELNRCGCRTVSRDDLDGMVQDVAIEIYGLARSWRPDGGAMPWVWAGARVREAVRAYLGPGRDELDDTASGETRPGPTTEPALAFVLRDLAQRDSVCALLDEALPLVASGRDRAVFLECAVQRALGDRSPAATVAGSLGIRADSVRQQTRRVRQRLRALADADDRFAPLAGLALVA